MSAAFTKGPWKWFGCASNNEVYLATTHSGRRYVMGFKRWGMAGAQPTFQPAKGGMVPAADLLTFEVGDRSVRGVKEARENTSVYRTHISGIDCADAHLIAASPTLYDALQESSDLLAQYVLYIRTVKADELERHPYLPSVEQSVVDSYAALALARGEAA